MKSRHGGPGDVPKGYNPDKYERPSVAVDIVLFTVRNNRLEALLIRRKHKPCAGMWALPGGFVDIREGLEAAALRELKEETGLDNVYIEQLRAYGDPDRDPRTRVISIAFIALAPAEKLNVKAGDDAADAAWHPAYDLPELAFDHEYILADALERLRKRILEAPLAFRMLLPSFTLTELRQVYEAALGKPVDLRRIRKQISAFGRLIPFKGKGRCDRGQKYSFQSTR